MIEAKEVVMIEEPVKRITVKSAGLTPAEVKEIVDGAQKYLPPTDEDGDPIKESINDHGN